MTLLDASQLAEELAAATELPLERGQWPHVKLPAGKTVQRLALEHDATGDVVLSTWPAELKDQANAFYGNPQQLDAVLDLCRTTRWRGVPNGHLSFWLAPRGQRWYFCGGRMLLGQYMASWIEDLPRVHAYAREAVEPELWPWLTERGYAGGALDRNRMKEFLVHARPEVHLRPGVWLSHRWSGQEARTLYEQQQLRPAIRDEAHRVLTALGERLEDA